MPITRITNWSILGQIGPFGTNKKCLPKPFTSPICSRLGPNLYAQHLVPTSAINSANAKNNHFSWLASPASFSNAKPFPSLPQLLFLTLRLRSTNSGNDTNTSAHLSSRLQSSPRTLETNLCSQPTLEAAHCSQPTS